MKLTLATIFLVCAVPLFAHKPKISKTSELIPIPSYSERYGSAGADSALKAARALIKSFDKQTQARILLSSDAPIRKQWSNLPASFFERGGVKIADMTKPQVKALFEFLSASLSREGYKKVGDILAAEAYLANDPRASQYMWAAENYWFAFYGQPNEQNAWGWQFGGHHLAINLAFDKGRITSLSPTFLGTEPAIFTLDGLSYKVITDLHHAGNKLFQSLNAKQKKQATYPKDFPDDVLTSAGKDDVTPEAEAIKGSDMNANQKALLLEAIRGWVMVQPKENADKRMKHIKAEIDKLRFTWKGDNQVNTPGYYRIQGPDLIIELLSTGNISQDTEGGGHYHTIYRVPSLNYGGD